MAAVAQARVVAVAGRGVAGGLCLALDLASDHRPGRTYAAYGGIYIIASLLWLWLAEGIRPDRWDVAGALICLAGAAIIVAGPRG